MIHLIIDDVTQIKSTFSKNKSLSHSGILRTNDHHSGILSTKSHSGIVYTESPQFKISYTKRQHFAIVYTQKVTFWNLRTKNPRFKILHTKMSTYKFSNGGNLRTQSFKKMYANSLHFGIVCTTLRKIVYILLVMFFIFMGHGNDSSAQKVHILKFYTYYNILEFTPKTSIHMYMECTFFNFPQKWHIDHIFFHIL